MKRSVILLVIGVVAVATLGAQGCDAEKAALKVFKEQGLIVLRPARDYVRVGGLVSVRQNTATYRDPGDRVPTSSEMATKFRALVMQQDNKSSTGIGAALSALGSIVPIPVGLKLDSSRQMTLAQIDTGGVRLRSDALDAQIQKPRTKAKMLELIGAGSEVFIVQEVYTAKSLDLKATTNAAFGVSLGLGELQSCATGGQDKAKEKEKSEEPKKEGAADQGKKQAAADAKPANATTPAVKDDVKSEANDNSKEEGTAVSVSVCRASEFTLRFAATEAIPFAVRLAPIEKVGAQGIRIRDGNFKFPKSLGSSRIEKATAEMPERSALSLQRGQ
jgi:hypothetical protein